MKYFIRTKRLSISLHPSQRLFGTTDYLIGSIYAGEQLTARERHYEWLECDGSPVNRQEYPELFQMIGTAFGNGDGRTTFNLPMIMIYE